MQTSELLTATLDGNVTIVVFGTQLKQIDEVNVGSVGDSLIAVADRLPHPLLVLDMTSIEFFGSSFIEILFRIWKKLSSQPGGQLALAGVQPYCEEVLKVTHLDSLWPIFDTKESASAVLNKASTPG